MTTMAPMMVMMPMAHLRTARGFTNRASPGQVPDRPLFDPGRRREGVGRCDDPDAS